MGPNDSLELFPGQLPSVDYQLLYSETWDQIEKDFHPYISLGFKPETLHPGALFEKVQTLLNQLLSDRPSELEAILYRVDLKESQKTSSTEQLAYFIVRREAQKVWLRKSFS